MKKLQVITVLIAPIGLIVSSHLIRGTLNVAPFGYLFALMTGQYFGLSLIPLAVGGACYLFKKKWQVFFTGWLIGFIIVSIGVLNQSFIDRGASPF